MEEEKRAVYSKKACVKEHGEGKGTAYSKKASERGHGGGKEHKIKAESLYR